MKLGEKGLPARRTPQRFNHLRTRVDSVCPKLIWKTAGVPYVGVRKGQQNQKELKTVDQEDTKLPCACSLRKAGPTPTATSSAILEVHC